MRQDAREQLPALTPDELDPDSEGFGGDELTAADANDLSHRSPSPEAEGLNNRFRSERARELALAGAQQEDYPAYDSDADDLSAPLGQALNDEVAPEATEAFGEQPEEPEGSVAPSLAQVNLAAMTPEERVNYLQALAQENPQELVNGFLRQDDYTRKTTEIAQQRGQLEGIASYMMERLAAVEQAQRAPVAPQASEPDDERGFIADWQRTHGELPTEADLLRWQMSRQTTQVRSSLEERIAALQEKVDKAAEQQVFSAIQTQWQQLLSDPQFPEAHNPDAVQKVGAMLDRMQATGAPGEVEQAFLAVYGRSALNRLSDSRQTASVQRRTQAQSAPGVPASTGGDRVPAARRIPSTNLDDIAEMMRNDPNLNRNLRRR